MLIARLIPEAADPKSGLTELAASLKQTGTPIASAALMPGSREVLEIAFPDGDEPALRRALEVHLQPVTFMITDHVPVVPRLLVSDMDSTIIAQECIDELAAYAGLKPTIAAITERAMRGELDFEEALRARVEALVGLPETAIADCLAEHITPTPGARELVQVLREGGCRTVLVTGGFHAFADSIGEMLGFDRVVANRLVIADGKLTGALAGSISGAETKRRVLEEERAKLGAGARVLALGDGANDAAMLAAADYGIAWHGKPAAVEAANGEARGADLLDVAKLFGIAE